ncbi:predicted protein [Sclerotinia sclerotiorum 1980 UF-70]|uniref:Uncharacterized protein n=1 Tax=Sclerotinia sclerotiorum (strain ATCC 18683 / 1980 / Ss-1) TaxID=665079 RepID=A7ENF7_SCLS1|nr:predicted protein [Sclerotinia sclerotiorum 1980 UF-70]EDO04373.1 predicted protein [Sclerotinia sclerotiorum 1980 UF-70]
MPVRKYTCSYEHEGKKQQANRTKTGENKNGLLVLTRYRARKLLGSIEIGIFSAGKIVLIMSKTRLLINRSLIICEAFDLYIVQTAQPEVRSSSLGARSRFTNVVFYSVCVLSPDKAQKISK